MKRLCIGSVSVRSRWQTQCLENVAKREMIGFVCGSQSVSMHAWSMPPGSFHPSELHRLAFSGARP